MNIAIYRSEERGRADYGWLNARYSFSFASFYDPEKIHFGALRVLNEDIIAPGKGFGTHPHDNMEIITIPLRGKLAHKDSMGNEGVIHSGEIQVMSAGTGIQHSEFNGSHDEEISLLQIWVLPRGKNLKPRYGQLSINEVHRENVLYGIISPDTNGDLLWINNDAWFMLGDYTTEATESYNVKKEGNGVYLFIIEGEAVINGTKLSKSDAAGISGTETVGLELFPATRLLLMDIPMTI